MCKCVHEHKAAPVRLSELWFGDLRLGGASGASKAALLSSDMHSATRFLSLASLHPKCTRYVRAFELKVLSLAEGSLQTGLLWVT